MDFPSVYDVLMPLDLLMLSLCSLLFSVRDTSNPSPLSSLLSSLSEMEDDNRFLDNERLQIEHIRELEMEELQIEEVEDTNNSSSSDDDFISNRDDDGGAGEYGGFTFDMGLASMHTYLGEVEDTHRRVSFLDGGAILNLPMFYLEGVVLFPGATLPLRVTQPSLKAAVERALNQVDVPYTIGVVRVHRNPNDHRFCFAKVGTTAEIRQYRRLEDGSLNVVTRGQQRFRLRRSWVDVDAVPCGEIQIIQEDLPLRTPRDAFGQLASVSNFWNRRLSYPVPVASCAKKHGHGDKDNDSETLSEASFESDLSPTELRIHLAAIDSCNKYDELINSDDESGGCEPNRLFGRSRLEDSGGSSKYSHNEKLSETDIAALSTGNQSFLGRQSPRGGRKEWATASKHRASMLFWPHWVFRMYDSYCLSQRAADMWKQIIGVPSMEDLVKKPDLLSFYIASKIPVSESTRQELLEIDGISYRLRREIELLECFDRVRCKTCKSVIAKRSDMLVMSSDGPLGAYVNPHGFVHEIMTLYKANGLALIGRPVEEYSWFPGYAWTITICSTCETQMGWLFTAIKKKLKPKSFWGIRSSQVADDIR